MRGFADEEEATRPSGETCIGAGALRAPLFGAVVGIVIGTALGTAMALALLVVAIPSLLVFLILSVLLGAAAASWPARRAARLDVLTAIAAD